jgi:hypothetical protein
MNPGGRRSGIGTPHSVSDVVEMETGELLRLATEEGRFGVRKQEALKILVRPEAFISISRRKVDCIVWFRP